MAVVAKWIGSPNRSKGRGGFRPEAIVIHIMEGTLAGTDNWFLNPVSQVSAHYGVGRNGEIHQYVAEGDAAWHAGRVYGSEWSGRKPRVNPNLYTIGIEHEGNANSEWPHAMYEASAALIREIAHRWSIPLDREHVIGHREIYARKTCPGSKVDLDRLIAMARADAVDPDRYNLVEQSGTVTTRVDLNLRKSAPTTATTVVHTIPAGSAVEHTGWTSNGLAVNGNAHWYRDGTGDYFWAGGTDRPVPGI
ncbi:MAG: N-acetylmuramoyl-L-alanine amidase [Longimicrobiales bacterium]